jgi:hypothetical protein
MGTSQMIRAAVRDAPEVVDRALRTLPHGKESAISLAAIRAAASVLDESDAGLLERTLRHRGLLVAFEMAMEHQGHPLMPEADPTTRPDWSDHIAVDTWLKHAPQAERALCRIYVDNTYRGTGCLVGPTTVLTAWHVIGAAATSSEGSADQRTEVVVELSDTKRWRAAVPALYWSECTAEELEGEPPALGADYNNHHDVALLRLPDSTGRHLGYVDVLSTEAATSARPVPGVMVLAHFPQGLDRGFGIGRVQQVAAIPARLQHDVTTAAGSSGGACFDRAFTFLGVHQGVRGPFGYLVPAAQFRDDLVEFVERDIAPSEVWRVPDDGSLVVGRDQLALAVRAAYDDGSMARGVWVRRRDMASAPAPLVQTRLILKDLVARRGRRDLVLHVPVAQASADLLAAVRLQAGIAGLELTPYAPSQGVTTDQAAAEGVARSNAAMLVRSIGAEAARAGAVVWLVIDGSEDIISEAARIAVEALVTEALTQPQVRLAIVGFEDAQLIRREFNTVGESVGAGEVGLLSEWVGTFVREDVVGLFRAAATDLGFSWPDGALDQAVDTCLSGHPAINGSYPSAVVDGIHDEIHRQLCVGAAREGGEAP